MILKKVVNNNVVCAVDEDGHDFIVVGLGLAYCVKPGNEIPQEKIERVFASVDENISCKSWQSQFLHSSSASQKKSLNILRRS